MVCQYSSCYYSLLPLDYNKLGSAWIGKPSPEKRSIKINLLPYLIIIGFLDFQSFNFISDAFSIIIISLNLNSKVQIEFQWEPFKLDKENPYLIKRRKENTFWRISNNEKVINFMFNVSCLWWFQIIKLFNIYITLWGDVEFWLGCFVLNSTVSARIYVQNEQKIKYLYNKLTLICRHIESAQFSQYHNQQKYWQIKLGKDLFAYKLTFRNGLIFKCFDREFSQGKAHF